MAQALRQSAQRTGGLVVLSDCPLNAETPLALLGERVTSLPSVFVRCHFDLPRLDARSYRLAVGGEVSRPLELGLGELQAGRVIERRVTFECAGNGRVSLHPRPPGIPWGYGAASTVVVTGTPLADVCARAGLAESAREIVGEGADRGHVVPGREVAFERALPREVALGERAILVWAMNGELLSIEHGGPLRLLVAGRYGVDSVKWLVRLTAVSQPFAGHFQVSDYVERRPGEPDVPVGPMRVRALFVDPEDGARLARGPVVLRGVAWSGAAPIRSVEVSVDGAATFRDAQLDPEPTGDAAAGWRLLWTAERPGDYELVVRAEDDSGARQPLEPTWNALGYGNNAAHRVHVRVL